MSEFLDDEQREAREAAGEVNTDKLGSGEFNAHEHLHVQEQPMPVDTAQAPEERELFQSFSRPELYSRPEMRPPERIPNFGHLCILSLIVTVALIVTGLLTRTALHHHLFGIVSADKAMTDIHYTLGSEGLLYLLTLAGCLIVFPILWQESFFEGLHWRFDTAVRLRKPLVGAAFACFVLALLSQFLMSGPTNAPIDKIFEAPGAAWLLFGFGVTFAPFFEEMGFRGFLLPAVCTAFDWLVERNTFRPRLPLDEDGHPQWSMPAMVTGTVVTSIPFALLHAQQTGWAIGPFCLLFCVSMVLCTVRLSTRSLASSTLVHASYNFLLFSIMLVGTGGFRNLDRM